MSFINHLRAARKSFNVWLNAVLLVAYPFADQIIVGVRDNLPSLEPYLPVNWFKTIGLLLVVYNIVHGARVAAKATQ